MSILYQLPSEKCKQMPKQQIRKTETSQQSDNYFSRSLMALLKKKKPTGIFQWVWKPWMIAQESKQRKNRET